MYRCSTNNTQWFANRNKNTQVCDALPGETDGSCHEVVWGWAHVRRFSNYDFLTVFF